MNSEFSTRLDGLGQNKGELCKERIVRERKKVLAWVGM